MHEEGEPLAAALDGTDGVHWRLPLPPLSASSLPEPYCPGDNPPVDRLEAAAKLVGRPRGLRAWRQGGRGQDAGGREQGATDRGQDAGDREQARGEGWSASVWGTLRVCVCFESESL